MNNLPLTPVSDADVDDFWRDGVICLCGSFDRDWIAHLRSAVEEVLAEPGPLGRNYSQGQGRFAGDRGLWWVKPGMRRFVVESPAVAIAARLLKSAKVNLLYDHLFVKEPGTAEPTPWHQDRPYWPVEGEQILSIWLALDDVTIESSGMEYVKGSHRWGKQYRPSGFAGPTAAYDSLPGEATPDFSAMREQLPVVNWEMKAGDCLVHHAMTVHGSPGNSSNDRRRRAYATRWTGDDVTYAPAAGQPRITIPDPTIAPGEPLDSDVFPRLWSRSGDGVSSQHAAAAAASA